LPLDVRRVILNGVFGARACLGATAVLTLCCATGPQLPSGTGESARARVTIVSYRTVGDVPPCARYALHRGAGGLAFVERSPLGFETEFPAHWIDPAGDHFAVWDVDVGERGAPVSVRDGPAKEVWIPADRKQPAYLFVYRAGLYEVRDTGGVKHPVPLIPVEARAKLEPLRVASP
jgi:hypothetical protein